MTTTSLPLMTMVLISFNQAHCIRDAVLGALAQDYAHLEICISDDASTDGTWDVITDTLQGYAGPHRIQLWRNPKNLGIGGNIDQTVRRSSGELIFITAGDDVSLPHRVSRVTEFWLQHQRRPDLIASYLHDFSMDGQVLGEIRITDLSKYRSLDDWIAAPPHVIGAAQAWTRRMFDRFSGLPAGVVGEDMVMAFRAIGSASAMTLPEPLVCYRRGGLTNQGRVLTARQVIRGLTRKLVSSQIELRTMLADARSFGASPAVMAWLEQKIRKEQFIAAMFARTGFAVTWKAWWGAVDQPLAFRIRVWTYAKLPWILAPFFWLKRLRYRQRVL